MFSAQPGFVVTGRSRNSDHEKDASPVRYVHLKTPAASILLLLLGESDSVAAIIEIHQFTQRLSRSVREVRSTGAKPRNCSMPIVPTSKHLPEIRARPGRACRLHGPGKHVEEPSDHT